MRRAFHDLPRASAVAVASAVAAASCVGDGSGTRTDSATASAVDYCAVHGWYADGSCDAFCVQLDADCAGQPPRDEVVIAEIEAWNATLPPEERTSKYCKMAASPLVFYRGSDHLYWHDLARDKRLSLFGGPTTNVWLQGDLHAQNYGAFDNDDGVVVYDLDDYDEVVIADYQLDVWRMAVSIALVAEQNGGFSTSEVRDAIDAFSEAYLDAVASYRGNDDERHAKVTEQTAYGLLDEFLHDVAAGGSRQAMLDEWTLAPGGGVRTFDLSLDDLAAVSLSTRAEITVGVDGYRSTTAGGLRDIPGYFTVKDVARRLGQGTGSLGVPRYYVLIEGRTADDDDDRILDVKRQGAPSAYAYLGATERALVDSAAPDHAARTIAGYRALATDADDHLGWMQLSDGDYSVRERSPYKQTFPVDQLDTDTRLDKLSAQWGAILAAAHSRADKDANSQLIPYSFDKEVDVLTDGLHAEFRQLVRDVALWYAAQVAADYQVFAGSVASLCAAP